MAIVYIRSPPISLVQETPRNLITPATTNLLPLWKQKSGQPPPCCPLARVTFSTFRSVTIPLTSIGLHNLVSNLLLRSPGATRWEAAASSWFPKTRLFRFRTATVSYHSTGRLSSAIAMRCQPYTSTIARRNCLRMASYPRSL